MATIETFNITDSQSVENYRQLLDALPHGTLLAQEIAQQAIIHALGHLIEAGCTEQNAAEMLDGLLLQASILAKSMTKRGFKSSFAKDPASFH